MKKKGFTLELWRYVMDASALINIERNGGIRALGKRKGAILLSEQVAKEVAFDPRIRKSDPLRQFVIRNAQMITEFEDDEGEEYLRIARQPGIGAGEASAMAIALKRKLPLVIDEKDTKARGKANNHGIQTLSGEDFLAGI
jgi:predicted nucleic acid-binding protein